jgi:outer membrane protein assembly factor BamB
MPRDRQGLLYVGIHNCVVGLDEGSGEEVWRTELGSAALVGVQWDGTNLYASRSGEVYRLHPRTGEIIWHNPLRGLGMGILTMVAGERGSDSQDVPIIKRLIDQQSES